MKKNNGSSGGIGISTVVQIVFIILKLIGTIDWPWGVVLIPLWIDLGILVLACMLWLMVIAFRAWRKK